jgi:hypothetical protein
VGGLSQHMFAMVQADRQCFSKCRLHSSSAWAMSGFSKVSNTP